MDYQRAWDWELTYVVRGSKHCGSLGRTSSQERAKARINAILADLPKGTTASGHITIMGDVPLIGDRQPLFTVARVQRTRDGRVIWSKP